MKRPRWLDRSLAYAAVAAGCSVALMAKLALLSRPPSLFVGDVGSIFFLWYFGVRLGERLARRDSQSRVRLLEAREHQLEAKLRIADLTIDSLRRTVADASGYRGEPSAAWRRPSA